MADSNDPRQDDRIEDLLGQLQGIFGRLSKTEQEEAEKKVDPKESASALPHDPLSEAPPPAPTPAMPVHDPFEPPPVAIEPEPAPPPPPPPPPPPIPEPEPEPVPEPVATAPVAPPEPPSLAPVPQASAYESSIPLTQGDNSILHTAIFYPQGRETEAKGLATKIETMTPRFTKISFRLRVAVFEAFEAKADWRDQVLQKTTEAGARAVFVIVNSGIDEARRKAMATDLEPRGIYFQEVPILSVEKKAFYMDLLLGIVFFFDSLKSSNG